MFPVAQQDHMPARTSVIQITHGIVRSQKGESPAWGVRGFLGEARGDNLRFTSVRRRNGGLSSNLNCDLFAVGNPA
jgi:hypothetical protein